MYKIFNIFQGLKIIKINKFVHSFLMFPTEHMASIKRFHSSLSIANVFTMFQVFPTFRASSCTALFHVFLGRLLPLASCKIRSRTSFSSVFSDFPKESPIHLHFLLYIYNAAGSIFFYIQDLI